MLTFAANFFSVHQYFDDSAGIVGRGMGEVDEVGGFACTFASNLGSR